MATPKAPDDEESNLGVIVWRVKALELSIVDLKQSDKDLSEAMEPVIDSIRQLQRDFDRRSGADRVITVLVSMMGSGLIAWLVKHFP